ncbi:MAG: transcriptional regulator, TetR family [Ilumatobacteraceae bacterium]|nr:transcriptional regulator, TetR family [Ilumatobacteraceae bacterium]
MADAPAIRSPRGQRSDAQASISRILAAAEVVFDRDGARSSLEEIARTARVGSATLHRHFPSRRHLIEQVFHRQVEMLCAAAGELTRHRDPDLALVLWLRQVATFFARTRGLANELLPTDNIVMPTDGTCYAMVRDVGAELVARAIDAGTVRPGTSITDLLLLIGAAALVSASESGSVETANRLIDLVIDGIRAPGKYRADFSATR